MLTISGYLTEYDQDTMDDKNAISVNSCGHYMLLNTEKFCTVRPAGRRDFQLLYIARGAMHALLAGEWHYITEGNIVVYFPGEPQNYMYYLKDKPEIYWIHFSGTDTELLINKVGFDLQRICNVGVQGEYAVMFDRIISELQIKRKHFSDICNLYFGEILLMMSRYSADKVGSAAQGNELIDQTVQMFHMHYRDVYSIEQIAQNYHVSTCWFIRCFCTRMGMTPQKYLTLIRINKAKELLLSSSYNIGEIAGMVGYQNPLYFSRIFRKMTNLSPSDYRKSSGAKQ